MTLVNITSTEIAQQLARSGRVRRLPETASLEDVVARMTKQMAAGLLHDGAGWDVAAIADLLHTSVVEARALVARARLELADADCKPCHTQLDGLMTFAADAVTHAMECEQCNATRAALREGKGMLRDAWHADDVVPVRPWHDGEAEPPAAKRPASKAVSDDVVIPAVLASRQRLAGSELDEDELSALLDEVLAAGEQDGTQGDRAVAFAPTRPRSATPGFEQVRSVISLPNRSAPLATPAVSTKSTKASKSAKASKSTKASKAATATKSAKTTKAGAVKVGKGTKAVVANAGKGSNAGVAKAGKAALASPAEPERRKPSWLARPKMTKIPLAGMVAFVVSVTLVAALSADDPSRQQVALTYGSMTEEQVESGDEVTRRNAPEVGLSPSLPETEAQAPAETTGPWARADFISGVRSHLRGSNPFTTSLDPAKPGSGKAGPPAAAPAPVTEEERAFAAEAQPEAEPVEAPPPPAPAPPPPAAPAPPPPPPPSSSAAIPMETWERLARCESGGDWTANTGNGFYGGLQFVLSSWRMVGGTGLPSDASQGEQIQRAVALHEIQGWEAWPNCSRQLGLR